MSSMHSEVSKAGKPASKGVCYCDLDGVFASYPECWLRFIETKTGQHFDSLQEAKESLSYADYVNLKNDYRSSDFKYNLTPRRGSSDFTRFLRQEGYSLVIATTRPFSHPQLMIRTIRWLDKNNILFNDLLFCDGELDVVSKYPNLSFCVEDEPHVANIMAGWGYRTFLLRSSHYDIGNLHKNVTVVDGFEDIMEMIKNESNKDENSHRKQKYP